jgi:sugar phosphate isomerase/epimerase
MLPGYNINGFAHHRLHGEIDFPPVIAALRQASDAGRLHIELSRHSHDAVASARRALALLRGVAG